MLPLRRSIIRFLLRPTCRVHVDALWEARNMEARSQEKLMNVCNTMGSRDEVSHTVLLFDCHALPHGILYVHVDSLWEAAV